MNLTNVPKKERKEETVVYSVRVKKTTWDRIKKLEENPDITVPDWVRKIISSELDKIGA